MFFTKKTIAIIFSLSIAGIFSLLLMHNASASPLIKAGLKKSIIADTNIKTNGKYTFMRCNALKKKPFDKKNPKKKLLIIGDSHGCDFLNEIRENNFLQNYQIRMRYIPYQCQPVLNGKSGKFVEPKDKALCANEARTDSLMQAKEQMSEADVIIFAARWKLSTARVLPFTIKHLRLSPHQKIIVIGSKSFGKITARRYMSMSREELSKIKNPVDSEVQKINAILRKRITGRLAFVDQTRLLCGSDTACPIFTKNLHLISYDGWHLTQAGARYMGKILFQKSILGKL